MTSLNKTNNMNWIKVSERLPEINQDVLVFTKWETFEVSRLSITSYDSYKERTDGYFEKLEVTNIDWIENLPTHWMPLPKKPKKIK